jgi:peptidylprolyl isomerase
MKFIFLLLLTSSLAAQEEEDVAKISEAMGHLIGKNLQDLGLNIDLEAVVRGLQDEAQGKNSPLSEEECVMAIASLQEESAVALSKKNLVEAESFLQANSHSQGVVSLEEGKLQYKVLKEGSGDTVQPYNSPLVRYSAKSLSGAPLMQSETQEMISLDDAIPGFSKGILGMKEGEVRTLYVHPDLSFGKSNKPDPNALLIFEIELIKADASSEAHAASSSETLPQSMESISFFQEETKAR